MKTKLTMLMAALLGVLSSREAQAFYNPSTGRWLSRDPIGETGGLSVYGFVSNDPVGDVDILGLIGDPGPDPFLENLRRSCLPCECESVEVTYNPGGSTLSLGGYYQAWLSPRRYGNRVHVQWKVSGYVGNCKFYQDEEGTLLTLNRVTPKPVQMPSIAGKNGNRASHEYTDRMGFDFTTGDKGTWRMVVHWNVTFRCVSKSGNTVTRHDTFDIETTFSVPWW